MAADRLSGKDQPEPRVLVGRGEISASDRSLVVQMLAHFGINASFMSPIKYERMLELTRPVIPQTGGEVEPNEYRFSSLASRDDFLLKEHLEDFRVTMHPEIRKAMISRVFNQLVDGKRPQTLVSRAFNNDTNRWVQRQFRDPEPFPGVVVFPRDALGLPPYTGVVKDKYGPTEELVEFGVQVGSIIDNGRQYRDRTQLPTTQGVHLMIATQLEAQIGAETN